jgi:redox-sensitive bicupin YhaK (pirin superfamily)
VITIRRATDRGRTTVGGHPLEAGGGAALSDEPAVVVAGRGDAEVMLFDLA